MKNSTIQLLHKGQRRKVQKLEYSKLRTYNKIKTSRVTVNSVGNSSVRDEESKNQITYEQLRDVVECLKKDILQLNQEIRDMSKEMKKWEKIDRVINKKYPQTDRFDDQKQDNIRQISLKNVQSMLQIKLALDAIELQQILHEKNQLLRQLSNSKRGSIKQQINIQLNQEKIRLLKCILNSQSAVSQKIQNLREIKTKSKQTIIVLHNRIKNCQKTKANQLRILQQMQYELKEVQHDSQNRHKRIRKDSCEYIEVQNGEIRNEQDIKNQIKVIKEKRISEGQELQSYLQAKMRQKIMLINQIQVYQRDCKQLRNKIEYQRLGSTGLGESIQI